MTKQRYLRQIAGHFPDIAYNNVQFIRRGWDNDVLVLDNQLVFRFPKRPEYIERFKTEVRLLQHMQGRFQVSVPDYICVPDDLSFGGYHIIPGRPLRHSIFNKLKATTRKNVARQLGQFLSVMHAIPVSMARSLGVGELEGGCWDSRSNTEIRFEAIKKLLFPKLNTVERNWLETHYESHLQLNLDVPLRVVHNDLTDDHIYVMPERGELGGFIDFGDVEFTDPAMDFAGLWLYGRSFVEEVLSHYDVGPDDELLERSILPYRVHSAEKMLEVLQGTPTAIPHSFEDLRKHLNHEMMLFKD